nr:Chain A, VEALYL peptide derived from human insulin chain B, residues 12-17 [unidentified]2OMQ_B Chain B, VEALYL peptide derived from human insulin chain B, residues 12-17 [unidentified]2OMQ_C Chain C, VEALYL peptide derived from human insulin chain B, residues 12-17 [unidentified]2OMQ_D Chain D, VEALYL peptide derived from human insulin chain B, residues 12-17 [unidentified]
VEALYL